MYLVCESYFDVNWFFMGNHWQSKNGHACNRQSIASVYGKENCILLVKEVKLHFKRCIFLDVTNDSFHILRWLMLWKPDLNLKMTYDLS